MYVGFLNPFSLLYVTVLLVISGRILAIVSCIGDLAVQKLAKSAVLHE